MTRTRSTWTAIPSKRSSADPDEWILVEVMEDGCALPKGTRFITDRPRCGQIRTFAVIDGEMKCFDLDEIEEVL